MVRSIEPVMSLGWFLDTVKNNKFTNAQKPIISERKLSYRFFINDNLIGSRQSNFLLSCACPSLPGWAFQISWYAHRKKHDLWLKDSRIMDKYPLTILSLLKFINELLAFRWILYRKALFVNKIHKWIELYEKSCCFTPL